MVNTGGSKKTWQTIDRYMHVHVHATRLKNSIYVSMVGNQALGRVCVHSQAENSHVDLNTSRLAKTIPAGGSASGRPGPRHGGQKSSVSYVSRRKGARGAPWQRKTDEGTEMRRGNKTTAHLPPYTSLIGHGRV